MRAYTSRQELPPLFVANLSKWPPVASAPIRERSPAGKLELSKGPMYPQLPASGLTSASISVSVAASEEGVQRAHHSRSWSTSRPATLFMS
jgi:hypothetical protein